MTRLLTTSGIALVTALIAPNSLADTTMKSAPSAKIVAASDISWGYLNPLRGDKSPGAADLWGDRTQDTATGMLVRFKKGFESPPHIHNITYRGIVIDGLMHNDDPNAEKMWLPTGSFWTQPAGEDHTTAANEVTNLIYLEIDSGPYLVKPSTESFDNGERPLNLHRDNMVWLNNSKLNNITAEGVKSTYLWKSNADINGSMVKLPAGFKGQITTEASEFKAVVIAGAIEYNLTEQNKSQYLSPGSYIESNGNFKHNMNNKTDAEATIYIRTNSPYQVK
jgi:quercetin dioxygenase-like cupin family protein